MRGCAILPSQALSSVGLQNTAATSTVTMTPDIALTADVGRDAWLLFTTYLVAEVEMVSDPHEPLAELLANRALLDSVYRFVLLFMLSSSSAIVASHLRVIYHIYLASHTAAACHLTGAAVFAWHEP